MALKIEQQIYSIDRNFINPYETERGGFASLIQLSGLWYATYVWDPSDSTVCLGVQQYDYEYYNLAIHTPSFLIRNAFPPFSCNHIIREGEVITNFIHPSVTSIQAGSYAYLAPSGFVTAAPIYTNTRVGRFISSLNSSNLGPNVGVSAVRVGGSANIAPWKTNTAGWAKIAIGVL